MPGPGNKTKRSKGTSKPVAIPTPKPKPIQTPAAPLRECRTLDEDGMIRCGQPATRGKSPEPRCKVHHSQYTKMYKKYKAAAAEVDKIKGSAQFPTKEQICEILDRSTALQKLRWITSYVEAIRIERYGRQIHGDRFFLKIDDGHKIRIKVLAKEIEKANDLIQELSAHALELYSKEHPEVEWAREPSARDLPEGGPDDDAKERKYEKSGAAQGKDAAMFNVLSETSTSSGSDSVKNADGLDGIGPEDIDLIDLRIQSQKQKLLQVLEPLVNFEKGKASFVRILGIKKETEHTRYMVQAGVHIWLQYMRRVVFYDDVLFNKALDKVSFRDFILSSDFTVEDCLRIISLGKKMNYFGLLWLKDAVIEGLEMMRTGQETASANLGKMENRFKVLGGWIYNTRHTKPVTNEVWWHLLKTLELEGNTENRYVRLCNSYEDLVGFLSVGAMGIMPAPKFCSNPDMSLDSRASRMHLSLSGVIIADMVSPSMPFSGPFPTRLPPKRRGQVVWGEAEARAYMFGAIRLEEDPFTERFLSKLRERPDLFQLLVWNETKPDSQAEEYGSAKDGKALPQMRGRNFEAPMSLNVQSPGEDANWPWRVSRSARDILFSSGEGKAEIVGYITSVRRRDSGWFFYFKEFHVRYIVIISTVAAQHGSRLMRQVAWAALCAGGYGEGEYTVSKYHKASDKLYDKSAKERLSWMPAHFGTWNTTKMSTQKDPDGSDSNLSVD